MYHCDDNPFFAESEFACEFASGLGPHRKKKAIAKHAERNLKQKNRNFTKLTVSH